MGNILNIFICSPIHDGGMGVPGHMTLRDLVGFVGDTSHETYPFHPIQNTLVD